MTAVNMRWRLAGAVALCALTLWLHGPAAVKAQAASEPAGYRAEIDSAIAEYEARNFAEARALFARAHALYPNARTLRGQGMAEFELRNYADAIQFLEQALAAAEKPLEGSLRTDTEALLGRARSFVGRVELTVEPASAGMTVDGTPHDIPVGGLLLNVGDHRLDFSAPGYLSEKRDLKLTGGDQISLDVVLSQQAAAVTGTGVGPVA